MITITEMAEVHAARIAERDGTIAALTAENERLRELVRQSYIEGFGDGVRQTSHGEGADGLLVYWQKSDTRAALQPKEGE